MTETEFDHNDDHHDHDHDDHDHDDHDDHDHFHPTPTFLDELDREGPQADIQYTIDPSNPDSGQVGTQIDGHDIWSAYRTAQHIVRGGSDWQRDGNTVVTYTFSDADNVGSGFEIFEQINKAHTRVVFEKYAEVSNVTFQEVGATDDANITLKYRGGSYGGGYWDGRNVVVSRVGWEPEMEAGTYNMRLMLHEVGHALGLSHPGDYNGSSASYDDVDHWNDSRQYTNLSYWSETYTGGSFGSMSTLGLHDILATQIEYGVNWETRSGDNTYGFNSNSGDSYDFTSTRTSSSGSERANTDMAFSIWDGGGVDTLDFSGSNAGTEIDLRDGAFSSANGQTYNVSIAYGVVIENGVGSAHDDTIRGNAAANILTGGDGDDILIGGAEQAVDTSVDPRHFTGIEMNADPLTRDQYVSATNVSAFSGDAFTLEMMVELIRSPSSVVAFASYAVQGSTNEFLIEGVNNGVLRITLNGSTYSTGIETESLVDGQPHRLSVSWDSETGQLDTYIDGVLADSGIHQQGRPLASGGTLIFGQEQDNVGGGFQTNQFLPGTIGDMRIFDTARTAQDVADHAFGTVAPDTAGLKHNWQVAEGDTDTISDVATSNPPVDLTTLLAGSFTASQSSQYSTASAARILDDENGTYNHTRNSGDEWVLVEFGQSLDVTHVEVVNRPGWGSRLDGTTVSVLDAAGNVIHVSAPISGIGSGGTFTLALPEAMAASAVRLDQDSNFLHVAEVNILGNAPDGVTVDPALHDTDATIHEGATVRSTAPVIDTTPDNDTLDGGLGDDTLSGGAGDDILIGGLGEDTLNGGLGDDKLIGGLGEDTLTGGLGDDTLYAVATERQSLAHLFDGIDPTVSEVEITRVFRDMASASQTSQWGNNAAERAIDGNTSTFNHTQADDESLTINLGATFDLTKVVLTNRSGEGSRLNDAVVELMDASGQVVHSFAPIKNAYSGQVLTFTLDTSVDAASVRVVDPTSYLHVAELQVFGTLRDLSLIHGSNTVYGGDGDDTIVGGAGGDVLEGGAGTDTLVYDRSVEGVTVDLNGDQSASGGDAEGDTISGFERVIGSVEDDTITGDADRNMLVGLDGDDEIMGGEGNDVLEGGAGGDTLSGGEGEDWLYYTDSALGVRIDLANNTAEKGDAEGDTISGFERVLGSGHRDWLTGDEGWNKLIGRNGTDVIEGGAGGDTLDGGNGYDWVRFLNSDAGVTVDLTARGEHGYQRASGGDAAGDRLTNFEAVTGSDHNDRLVGNEHDNHLLGGRGADLVEGGSGADVMNGGRGYDWVRYRLSDEAVTVDLRTDAVTGFQAAEGGDATGDVIKNFEAVEASNHADWIIGNDSRNHILGRGGDDVIEGGGGNDFLFGGNGADTFVFAAGDGLDTIIEFVQGVDTLSFTGLTFAALTVTETSNGAQVAYGDDVVTINVETPLTLTEDDFLFT